MFPAEPASSPSCRTPTKPRTEADLLLDRCVAEAETLEPGEVCSAYELLFDLLREIDRCERDIVFWADEGGTWNFMIPWTRVLLPYFRSLTKVMSPPERERRARVVLDELVDDCDRAAVRRLLDQTLQEQA